MYDEFEESVKDLVMKQDALSWSVAQQNADSVIERNRLNKLESRDRVLFLYNALKEHTVDLEHRLAHCNSSLGGACDTANYWWSEFVECGTHIESLVAMCEELCDSIKMVGEFKCFQDLGGNDADPDVMYIEQNWLLHIPSGLGDAYVHGIETIKKYKVNRQNE